MSSHISRKKQLHIRFDYYPSMHLSQVYAGFYLLQKNGIIELDVNKAHPKDINIAAPLLKVIVNNEKVVWYDLLDGFNWIEGSKRENLCYFHDHFSDCFYFKRSFHTFPSEYISHGCKVFPLGLNYPVHDVFQSLSFKKKVRSFLSGNDFISNLLQLDVDAIPYQQYESTPASMQNKKILFMAGLWDPDNVNDDELKAERESLNKNRVNLIRACKKEFGDMFTGGLQDTPFVRRYAPDIILPFETSRKISFIQQIKNHAICISTRGLFDSTGWKFGEYVAASRCIVSEQLYYGLPGDFKTEKNYLSFANEDELLASVSRLVMDGGLRSYMMHENQQYYKHFLNPSRLVYNTLSLAMEQA